MKNSVLKIFREALCHCLSDQIAKRVARTADNSDIPKDAYQCQRLQVVFETFYLYVNNIIVMKL